MSTGVNLRVKEQEKKKSRQLLFLGEAGSCRHPSSSACDLRPCSWPPTDQGDFRCARGDGERRIRKWKKEVAESVDKG